MKYSRVVPELIRSSMSSSKLTYFLVHPDALALEVWDDVEALTGCSLNALFVVSDVGILFFLLLQIALRKATN
ncbi:hypothetical protein [Brachymonas denitrificans]|jgi:hypothetical protein|uniref:hypothetical protein n=1 Tax=Brachymonas denitrificans TaxID=28220 RepID=UPI00321FB289